MKLYHRKYFDSLPKNFFSFFFLQKIFFSNVPNEHGRSFETFHTSLFVHFLVMSTSSFSRYYGDRPVSEQDFTFISIIFVIFCYIVIAFPSKPKGFNAQFFHGGDVIVTSAGTMGKDSYNNDF